MQPLPAKKIIRILEKHGFVLSRQRGSHQIFVSDTNTTVVVPSHGGNKRLPIGTFLSIVKQSRLPKESWK